MLCLEKSCNHFDDVLIACLGDRRPSGNVLITYQDEDEVSVLLIHLQSSLPRFERSERTPYCFSSFPRQLANKTASELTRTSFHILLA
ncbi:hypothetical protein M758_6G136900 [Ceratodon purpureus]|nr:hypothetical protein M758_6G136900 [Ceratodon purpureus]